MSPRERAERIVAILRRHSMDPPEWTDVLAFVEDEIYADRLGEGLGENE
jgi:hypothetical protein